MVYGNPIASDPYRPVAGNPYLPTPGMGNSFPSLQKPVAENPYRTAADAGYQLPAIGNMQDLIAASNGQYAPNAAGQYLPVPSQNVAGAGAPVASPGLQAPAVEPPIASPGLQAPGGNIGNYLPAPGLTEGMANPNTGNWVRPPGFFGSVYQSSLGNPGFSRPPVPSAGYGMPPGNYGVPSAGYGMPVDSYGAPSSSWGPPTKPGLNPSSWGF